MELMKEWTDSGRTAVPLTPYTKKLLREQVDQFGNQFQALGDMDQIRLINGGLKHYLITIFDSNAFAARSGNSLNAIHRFFGLKATDIIDNRKYDSDNLLLTRPAPGIYYEQENNTRLYFPSEYRNTSKQAGGFRQTDLLEIGLLAHELTHSVQQVDLNKWRETLKQNKLFSKQMEKETRGLTKRKKKYILRIGIMESVID